MASFLTPKQFAGTKAAKSGGTYSSYKNWVTKKRQQRSSERVQGASTQAGQFAQSFGQTSEPVLRAQAISLFPRDPNLKALTNQQLIQQTQGIVNPIFQNAIKTITNQINERSRLGTNAIQGYGQAYQQALPQIQSQVAGIYGQAKNEQAGVNEALTNLIRNQNAGATNELAGAASAAGQLPAAPTAPGAAAATAGYGGSTLERLIGQGASQQAFTAQLPAFGQALQTQTLGNFLGQQNATLADQTSQIQGQLPQTLADTYQNLLNRELDKGQLRAQRSTSIADFYNQGLSRNVESRALGAQIYGDEANRQQDASQFAANIDWQREQAGLNDPKNATWDQKLGELGPKLAATADQLHQNTLTKSGLLAKKGLSYGKIRGRLNALIRGQLGGAVPQKLLKFYVDQALQAAGWSPPSYGALGAGQQVPDFGLQSIMGGSYGVFPLDPQPGNATPPPAYGFPPGLWGTAAGLGR